jgi:hypothetical protein
MKLVVGAYPAAPRTDPWSSDVESAFLTGISGSTLFRGWEIPFSGALHGSDESWYLGQLRPGDEHVVTAVPRTAMRARTEPAYGLASVDEGGRAAALADLLVLRDAVARLVAASGGRPGAGTSAVVAVEIQSAPGNAAGPGGSPAALVESLVTLAGWDWSGAQLVVEHCDATRPGHEPAKGFLSLPDELSAIDIARRRTGLDIGCAINWGRSAIEGRSAATPADHVGQAARAGLLSGLMFSGVSEVDSALAEAWSDAHLPPRPIDPVSMLGLDEIADCLRAAGDLGSLRFLGAKIQAAAGSTTADERAASVLASLDVLSAGVEASGGRI